MSRTKYTAESKKPKNTEFSDTAQNQQDHQSGKYCKVPITIENKGTINMPICSAVPIDQPTPEKPRECPPLLPPSGSCVPLALGSKHKKSLQAKLRPLLENNKVPSALASAFFQMARRFLHGRSPANSLEAAAFEIFQNLRSELRDILSCSLQTFDALPPKDRGRLFATELIGSEDQVVDQENLAQLVSRELLQRTSLEVFHDEDCILEERPGQVRLVGSGDDDVGATLPVLICRVNGLRTNSFQPPLSLSEYTPEELENECTLEVVNGQVQLNCKVKTKNCPGNKVERTCLRVPDIRPGEAVILQGVNFFNIESRVRLEAKSPGTLTREAETHVCGDETTPVTEIVDGQERTIVDCRVHDILTFKVPDDLPVGIYGITVIVPNNTGLSGFGDEFESAGLQYIRVLPPETATFQIASETLNAVKETSPAWWGSDEVGIRIISIPIALDLTPGEQTEYSFEFGDVDSGESRAMNRTLFRQSNIAGVSLSIIGFEIDNRDLFEKDIKEFADVYSKILKSNWNAIAGSVGTIGGGVAGALGLSAAWVAAIAAAITLVINVFVALWAPADLIIEDALAFTTLDLASLTSPNFPPPSVLEFTSAGGIDVRIEPVSKDVQYLERRVYRSDEEDSEYHITLRYNRF